MQLTLTATLSLALASGPICAKDIESVDDVISKYVDAIGGLDLLHSIQTLRKTYVVSLPDGTEGEAIQEFKTPDKLRAELRMGKTVMVTFYDGSKGYVLLPGQSKAQEMSEEDAGQLAMEADFPGPLVDAKSKGHKLRLIATEQGSIYEIEVIRKGSTQDLAERHFIDAQTFLPIKVVTKLKQAGQVTTRERAFSDYRPVQGLVMPHRIDEKQTVASVDYEYVYQVSSIELDVEIPESRFLFDSLDNQGIERERIAPLEIDENAEARSIYQGMIRAMRAADSLAFESDYSLDMGMANVTCRYKMWLKKPNQFRMEAFGANGRKTGVLVGDGSSSWVFWPNGRPPMSMNEDPTTYQETKHRVYMTKPTPKGHHSIGHDAGLLGAGMVMTIFDHSTFHGYTDSLQPLIDAVGEPRTEIFEDEECDVILVSFMDGQRSWEFWISKDDHLPRKLREIVRVHTDLIAEERWSNIEINQAIHEELFRWTPPEGWNEWKRPDSVTRLLPKGTPAPDFHLAVAGGGTLRLSDLRGQVVMLVFWRSG